MFRDTADIVLFSLTRNNPERIGAHGTLQDINAAISRAKEKLIILGNFDMMLNGWTSSLLLIDIVTKVLLEIWPD